MKKPCLMIQGTMSGAGKSLIAAGLCRMFFQDGMSPAPFKSQNMALNSYVTTDGCEMGRAQVMQACAAGLEPTVDMNPILLKPTDDTGSQVIVNGHPIGNMSAREYFAYKKSLIPEIKKAYESLASKHSPIIIEGAGSPAEINLKENDIVNMGLAEMLDAPVLLVGDIDRGGVFAQLYGTVMLLTERERARIKGFIINKFRGDPTLLDPGIKEIEEKTGIPVVGVVPYIPDLKLEDEDSLTERFNRFPNPDAIIKIAVIRLPRISNFSDFDPFDQNNDVSVYYTTDPNALEEADLIMIPGSKNTIADMHFLKDKGIADALQKLTGKIPIFGICGGLQMLGGSIEDPENTESGGSIQGLGLLPIKTTLHPEKHQTRTKGRLYKDIKGILASLSDLEYEGYEIHVGVSSMQDSSRLPNLISTEKDIYGTYIHGLFDTAEITMTVLNSLAAKKAVFLDTTSQINQRPYRALQYDHLAKTLRSHLNMNVIHSLISYS